MLDASGSMQSDLRLAQGASIKFLNLLPHAEDITLVDFDTEVRITRSAPSLTASTRRWAGESS